MLLLVGLIVYVEETTGLRLFDDASFAKNFTVVVESKVSETGLVPLVLDVVGVEPSVV